MARQLRIEYAGEYYHVFSRGNARCEIVLSDEDRYEFLNLLNEMSERVDVDVHAYVLMTNHYHLLLRTRKVNLSKSMHWLGTGYTRCFNLRHSRCGHLFQAHPERFFLIFSEIWYLSNFISSILRRVPAHRV